MPNRMAFPRVLSASKRRGGLTTAPVRLLLRQSVKYLRGAAMHKISALFGLSLSLLAAPAAAADKMAPLADYLMPRDAEIARARSAAPPSISADATVLVLGKQGYETAAPGTNGFTCLVERGWEADFRNPEFWNAKVRGPICFNAAAVKTVWPSHSERTDWALAGLSMDQMHARARASKLANAAPAPGAMCFMMSKGGYLTGADGHWHPHLMFYL